MHLYCHLDCSQECCQCQCHLCSPLTEELLFVIYDLQSVESWILSFMTLHQSFQMVRPAAFLINSEKIYLPEIIILFCKVFLFHNLFTRKYLFMPRIFHWKGLLAVIVWQVLSECFVWESQMLVRNNALTEIASDKDCKICKLT